MELNENLTYLQKTALNGEIALVLNSAPHDAEIKYRTFILLKETKKELRKYVLEGVKDFVDIPDAEIDRIYLEVLSNKVPIWLWIEKTVEDLKAAFKLNEGAVVGGRSSANKKDCRKSIIESAFLQFLRHAMSISISSTKELCLEILDCYELEFLHSSAFYILSVCEELLDIKQTKNNEVPMKLLDCTFNVRDILSFRLESKALDLLNKAEFEPDWGQTSKHEGELTRIIEIDSEKGITTEQLSNFLSQKITELFDSASNDNMNTPPIKPPTKGNHHYIVKKVFKGTTNETILRDFENIEEAKKFRESIEKKFPDLLRTCEFIIEEK